MIPKSDIAILSVASILLMVAIMRLDGPSVNETTNTYYTDTKLNTLRQVARDSSSASKTSSDTSLTTTIRSDPFVRRKGGTGYQNTVLATSEQVQSTMASVSSSADTGGTSTEFQQPDVIQEASFTTHVVERGEHLSLIAKRYKTTVAELKKLNNIDGTIILVGQELVYPTN